MSSDNKKGGNKRKSEVIDLTASPEEDRKRPAQDSINNEEDHKRPAQDTNNNNNDNSGTTNDNNKPTNNNDNDNNNDHEGMAAEETTDNNNENDGSRSSPDVVQSTGEVVEGLTRAQLRGGVRTQITQRVNFPERPTHPIPMTEPVAWRREPAEQEPLTRRFKMHDYPGLYEPTGHFNDLIVGFLRGKGFRDTPQGRLLQVSPSERLERDHCPMVVVDGAHLARVDFYRCGPHIDRERIFTFPEYYCYQTVETYVMYSMGVGILRIVSSSKYVHIFKRNADSPWDYLGHRTIATDNMVIRTCMITQDLKFTGFMSTYPL